jgi:phage terminase large subunit GpA-like protein
MSPDAWSTSNRRYPPTKGRPGPRDPHYTPYVVDFIQAFDHTSQLAKYGRTFDSAALACGSQMGKTDATLDIVGWGLAQRPAPMMYLGPTEDFVKNEFEPRLVEMLTGTPDLSARLAIGKKSKIDRKVIGGVPLQLAWAGSAARVAGMAAKVVLVDELDRMSNSVKGEGDPWTLTEARGFSYRDRMRGAISTPLVGTCDTIVDEASGLEMWKRMEVEDVQSAIWRLWQSGTMHHFCWKCPHCQQYFVPRFKQLRWPENATPAHARRTAWLECPRCEGEIFEHHKPAMNATGRYVAPGQSVDADGVVTGPLPETTTLSFWVSGLCSPFVTFGERSGSFLTAKLSGEQDKIQAVMNTGFGELHAPGGGDVAEWQQVKALSEPYPYRLGQVPQPVRFLTAGVDVQANRLVYAIRGWGAGATSWLIQKGEVWGATTEDGVWTEMAELLTTTYGGLPIRMTCVDSGFRPGKPINVPVNKVYEFVRRYRGRMHPTKGKATAPKPIQLSRIETRPDGKQKPYGLDLLWLDSDHWKRWVHERILWPPSQPGAWYLPGDIDDDYCKQIVSEARVKSPSGVPTWVARSRNNHFLDCEALAAAAGYGLLNAHRLAVKSPEPETETPPADESMAASPEVGTDNAVARPDVPPSASLPRPAVVQPPAAMPVSKPVAARPSRRPDPAAIARMFR